ncbi:cytochrome c5 family protein [Mitsuaria sp. WAJ17]|uniref:c-type cytochrome n=1 Tax=Mitsuaria sp. WAJ17 TaxID=2761452 RepID=UPI0016027C58|nr:c-type cytochrome [Mitsuaria sp. WAJ17]MBB2485160.1 cytochrome c5 family protein [Mitsuaria sp. WAJ17]
MGKTWPHGLALLAPALLTACGQAPQPPGPADVERAERARPADARLAQRYEQACVLCHARPDSGAPLSHHALSWASRLERGLPALVQSVQSGKGGMPAGGLCADCSPQDLESLTRFMSGPTP